MNHAFVNGEMLEISNARLPITDRGLRFGDGLFETIRVHRGVPYLWEHHMERLNEGLQALRIPLPAWDIKQQARAILIQNTTEEGILRIAITRGSGSQGYMPTGNKSSLIIETQPLSPASTQSLWLSTYRRLSPHMLPSHCKTMQGLTSTLALLEAKEQGHDNALLLSAGGYVSESANANLFWRNDGRIYTPPFATGCVGGVTRRRIMELAPITEAQITFADLLEADAVALSNCRFGLIDIAQIASPDGTRSFAPGFSDLAERLTADRARYADSFHADWHHA